MINDLIQAFYFTWPAWAFLTVLGLALVIEEGIVARNKKRLVDNPTLW